MSLKDLSKNEKDELIVSLSALMLSDSDLPVTTENLKIVIDATKNDVEAYWPMLFARMLAKHPVESLLASGVGVGGAAGGDAPAEEAAEEEAAKEESEEEESSEEGGMGGLFGDDEEEDW